MKPTTKKKALEFIGDLDAPETLSEGYVNIFNELPIMLNLRLSDKKYRQYLKTLMEHKGIEPVILEYEQNSVSKKELTHATFIDEKNKIIIMRTHYGAPHLTYSEKTPEGAVETYLELTKGCWKAPVRRKRQGKIYILSLKGKGLREHLTFAPFPIPKFELSVEENYNDDFAPKNEEILKRLNTKDDNGIVILHGAAGTGKTFYLRHLCKVLKKKILYVPPSLVEYIVEPMFLKILGNHKGSVIVIEDADNILRKRDETINSQSVSSILNISDGMLTDVLNLQIVATFNTKLSNIDEAFLRKGRLIAEYQFKELEAKKAQKLSKKLGYKDKITKAMTLADIYNQDTPDMREDMSGQKLGFKRNGQKA